MENSPLNHYVMNGNALLPAVNFIAQANGNVIVNDNGRFIQNVSQFQPQFPIQYSSNNVALMNQDAAFQPQYPDAFAPQGQVYYQSVIAYVANTRTNFIPPTQFAYLVPCMPSNSFPGPQMISYPQNVTFASCNSVVSTNGMHNITTNSLTYNNYRSIGPCLAEGNDSLAGSIARNDQQIAIRNEDCIFAGEGGNSFLETRRIPANPNIGTINEEMRHQAGPSENDEDLEIVYESIRDPPERTISRRRRKKKVIHRYVRRILPKSGSSDLEYNNEEIYEHVIDISTWNPPKTEILDCDSPFPDIKPDILAIRREPLPDFPRTNEIAGTSHIKCEPLDSSELDSSSIITINLDSPIAETTPEQFEESLENEPDFNDLSVNSDRGIIASVASARSAIQSLSEMELINSSLSDANAENEINSIVCSNDEAGPSFMAELVERNVICEIASQNVETTNALDLSNKARVFDYSYSNTVIPSTAENEIASKVAESNVYFSPPQNAFNSVARNQDGPLDLTISAMEEQEKLEEDFPEDGDSIEGEENLMNFSAEINECNFDQYDVFSDDTNLGNIFTDFDENNYSSGDGGYTIHSEVDNSIGNFSVTRGSACFPDSIEASFPESIGIDALDNQNVVIVSPFAHTVDENQINSTARGQPLSYGENYTATARTRQSPFGESNYNATALAQRSAPGETNISFARQLPIGDTNLDARSQHSVQSSFEERNSTSLVSQLPYEVANFNRIPHGEANLNPPVRRLPVIQKNYSALVRQLPIGEANVNSPPQRSPFRESNFTTLSQPSPFKEANSTRQSPFKEKNFTQQLSLDVICDYAKEAEINICSSEVIAPPGEISNDRSYNAQLWNKPVTRDPISPFPNEPITLDSDLVEGKSTNDVEILSQYSARKKRKSAFASVSNMSRNEDSKPKALPLSLQRMNCPVKVDVETKNVKHLRCYLCDLNFATAEEKVEHVNSKHDVQVDDPFSTKWLFARCVYDSETLKMECRLCNLSCPSIVDVFEHMVVDHGMHGLGLTRTCPTCFSTFSTADEYKNHIKEIHQYECLICGRKTTCKAAYALHQKRHMAVRPYQCAQCDKCFVTKQKLREHINVHTGHAPIKCNECGKSFKRYSNCYQHRQYCAGYKSVKIPSTKVNDFFCSSCNQLFHSRKKLRWHEELHEPPKKCSICLEKFMHRGTLTRHQRIKHGMGYANSQIRLVECALCFKTYSKSSMINHVKSHLSSGSFFCTQCPKTFKSKCNLESHKWTHVKRINKPFQCKECGTGYVAESEYQAHLRSHKNIKSYSCNYCGRPFRRRYNCKRHIREHEEEPRYKCELCLKPFHRSSYLKDHMKTHTGERPYRCHICGKTSAVKSNHNKHMTTHMAKESDHNEE